MAVAPVSAFRNALREKALGSCRSSGPFKVVNLASWRLVTNNQSKKKRPKDVQATRFATRLLRNLRGFLPGLLDLLLSFFLQPHFALGVFLATDAIVGDRQLVVAGGVCRLQFYAGLQG